MLKNIKKRVSLDNPLRLFYHKMRAIWANIITGFPHKNMIIIGITGTNGKTTTCNIVARGLREAGKKVFMFTTVNIIVNDEEFQNDTKMTSPDAFVLQKWLAYAKKKGCEIAVIETASHGIKMNRIWGLNYDIVALTNITQDHLDLHGTMKDYVNTKLEIFKKLMYYTRKPGVKKVAVINSDSKYAESFTAETFDTLFTYGKNFNSNLRPDDIESSINGTSFSLKIPGDDIKIKTKLIGDFNIYNIMCAVGIFMSLGFSRDLIEKSVAKVQGVPGRMDSISSNDGFNIYIDYAHTEDALENVLTTLKRLDGVKRIITVFGATGDRDRTKRSGMGEIVNRYSDIIILTEDDNYSEDIHQIIKDVLPGIDRKQGENFWTVLDRKEAIRTALLTAREGDIVLLAGKGDEHIIIRNHGNDEWHDKTIAQEILDEIEENKLVVKK